MLLLLDNRDSFVFNLDQAFRAMGQATRVVRSDRSTAAELLRSRPTGLVLSPGPGRPSEAGCLLEIVRRAPRDLPILGVCLGHQALAEVAGAHLTLAPEVFHGRTSAIVHDGRDLFAGLPSPLEMCRYHSLVVSCESDGDGNPIAPDGWQTSAMEPRQKILMAMRHETLPRWGLQFHPESFRSPLGTTILARFLDAVSKRPARDAG